MKEKVLVAMSGGVDSSVAAYLLKQQGYRVMGATMKTWASEHCDRLGTRACCSREGVRDARDVAAKLSIPYAVFDFEREFKKAVIDYFNAEYLRGRTPNPCIVCNQEIKFKLFRERARALGADRIATGHYAKVLKEGEPSRYYVQEGSDGTKDQSYVLFSLSQKELSHLLLPLGDLKKQRVREIAKEAGLPVSGKADSQEICFIPSNDYAGFLKKEIGLADRPGLIKNREGKILGEHKGFFHFTVGQRKGLGIAHRHPLFVTRIDAEKNEVIAGPKAEVLARTFIADGLNWMMPETDKAARKFQVKIRSAHKKSDATVHLEKNGTVRVVFDKPQEAITPGQAAVFYDGPTVMGGGWIRLVLD
ncbi:MAG TPA: tRNA 2-thiouridine(34) synthase MnmA [Candidatus Omnitrophota bacterium]|nr:tRNA 2-thiouridine(34) synthase MnmA [Candidatus Omnitrophota bacterium]